MGVLHGFVPAIHGQESDVTLLDAIVVTGERQERNILETTVGISVIQRDELERNSLKELNDILTQAPNLITQGPSELPIIRGVQGGGAGGLASSGVTGALPRLPIVVDGVARPAAVPNISAQSLWDANQIEVLRGPQTLLRGRSGLAGAIVINTNEPADHFEAAVQSGITFDSYSDSDLFLNGMVSGPLSDKLAVRATLELRDGDDPRRAPETDDDWITNYDNIRGRVKLKGEFDTAIGYFTSRFLLEHQEGVTPQTRNNVSGPGSTGRSLDDRVLVGTNVPTRTFNTWATTVALDNTIELTHGSLQIVTSYTSDDYDTIPEQTFPSQIESEEDIFVQELLYRFGDNDRVFSGQASGLVGLAIEERTQNARIFGTPLVYEVRTKGSTQSIFSDIKYGLTDNLSIFGGARLQRYADKRDQVRTLNAGPFPRTSVQNFNETEYQLLPSLGLLYHFSDDQTISASVRRGYNPGGSSINLFTGQPYNYESETVTTLEATYRQSTFDGRLSYGVAAFYNYFEDPQLFAELVPGNRNTLQVVNQGAGVSYGLELDASWQVTDQFMLNGSLGLLETKITEAGSVTPALEGNSFGQDPAVTASLGAVFQVNDYLSIDGRVTYVGESYNDFNEVSVDRVGNYALVDIGATARHENVELRAFVNNLFNETGVTRYVSNQQFADVTEPLTAGLTLTARW